MEKLSKGDRIPNPNVVHVAQNFLSGELAAALWDALQGQKGCSDQTWRSLGTTSVSSPGAVAVTEMGRQQLLPNSPVDVLRSWRGKGQKLFAGRIYFSTSCLHICGKASSGHGQLRKCISLHSAACELWQCPARDLFSKISFIFSCLE